MAKKKKQFSKENHSLKIMWKLLEDGNKKCSSGKKINHSNHEEITQGMATKLNEENYSTTGKILHRKSTLRRYTDAHGFNS